MRRQTFESLQAVNRHVWSQPFQTASAVRRTASLAIALAAVISSAPFAQAPQEKIDRDMFFRIRSEAAERSQILNTLHILTDVYGPRLTGSPNLKAAQDWVVKRTT